MMPATSQKVLKMLRQLPPGEQLKVILLVLPEIEKSLGNLQARPRKSLHGLWAGANITAKDISAARKDW